MRTYAEKPQTTTKVSPARAIQPARLKGKPASKVDAVLALQRTVGNRAVQRLLAEGRGAGSRGTGGRSMAGDQEGEAAVLGGNGVQAQPTALGGDATRASTANLPSHAPNWGNAGFFNWWIRWVTDGTSGWIVQRIENTYSGTKADGSAITNASVGVTPSYYEAWEVASDGTITGSLGATGNRDRWERPDLSPLGSRLNLSMTGTVYWTNRDPAASGFTSGGVANAGSLLSSTSAPPGLSAALLTRHAYGAWASDGSQMLPGCFTS